MNDKRCFMDDTQANLTQGRVTSGHDLATRAPVTKGWVQTERSAHQAWARLGAKNASASTLLHVLVANMNKGAAVVASRQTLSKLAGFSEATVKRSVAVLKAENFIQVVQLGGKGGVNAYVINSRVAWADSRSNLNVAAFTAQVLASADEQEESGGPLLRRIPSLFPGELQLPTGPGEDPPSQPGLDGIEPPDLPFTMA